jgi:hypothetical protein
MGMRKRMIARVEGGLKIGSLRVAVRALRSQISIKASKVRGLT